MKKVFLYTLSSCRSCQALKDFLRNHGVPFDFVNLDTLKGMNYQMQREKAYKLSGSFAIPVVQIADQVRVGYDPDWLTEILALSGAEKPPAPSRDDWVEDPALRPRRKSFRMMFEPVVAALGYKFSPDQQEAEFLLEQVVRNEKRYGMPFCPCKMISADRERDLAIVCPCIPFHRKHFDLMKRCWCGLFVHRDVEDPAALKQVPETEVQESNDH